MLQSCLYARQDDLPFVAKEMHLFFESLVVTDAHGLQTSLMDFHHETSFRSILEDDSISSASRTCICSCSSKGVGLWLVVKSSMHLFHIAHFTFTLALHFCFGFI